jgi:hypothetical protein
VNLDFEFQVGQTAVDCPVTQPDSGSGILNRLPGSQFGSKKVVVGFPATS